LGLKAVCHIVAALPSRTLPGGWDVAASLAVAVHPDRGKAGPDGGSPMRDSSAADDQAPRLPASVKAVSRTKRTWTGGKTTTFSRASSFHVPVATAELHVVPSLLVVIS
jgi:hypothetical protein